MRVAGGRILRRPVKNPGFHMRKPILFSTIVNKYGKTLLLSIGYICPFLKKMPRMRGRYFYSTESISYYKS